MIQEVSASNLLSFNEVHFEPCPGLNLFSGPSGAGKSLLLGVMLALLG
ncbi:MAG: AAA family ATPase, partial [Campylobacterales bacterium]